VIGEKLQVRKAPIAQLALVRQRVVLRQRGLGVVLVQRQHDVALAFVAMLLLEVDAETADVVVSVWAPIRALEATRRVATDEVDAQSGRIRRHVVALGARTWIGNHAVVHSADVSHEVGLLAERLAALKARSTADLIVPRANVHLKDAVPSKRATAHFAHVVAQLEMHGVVVPVQVAPLGEPLVALGAFKVLARLALVNASFVVAQLGVRAEPSQTHIALRPVLAIEDRCLARLLVLFSIFSLILRSDDDICD
jgi:hypothetical protein